MSQLRCRPGDLAWVGGPCRTAGLKGRFVIVEEFYIGGTEYFPGRYAAGNRASWVCRPVATNGTLPVLCADGALEHLPRRVIWDHILRPIRPSDGEDETLQWAGKPQDLAITRPEAWDYQAYARERAREEV